MLDSSDPISHCVAKDVLQRLVEDCGQRPCHVGRVGVGEAADQQGGAGSGGTINYGGPAAFAVVVQAIERAAVDTVSNALA
ncbi:hypothetical protein [Mycobacterium leprae]|uniref:hypothetical protein n=1 Tax=Mycobacterium leprae TaxID=1769 RepID=UPI0007DAFED7|nr:hypothetical protein [Mycobacterium leprae]OAX71659.1 hypothetical protein A3216_04475 [Mycobacterium leprae 7935681]